MKTSIRKSLAAAALTGGLLFAGVGVAATPANAAPSSTQGQVQPRATTSPTPISGTTTQAGTIAGTAVPVGSALSGTFTLTQFVVQNGVLTAVGDLTGLSLTTPTGGTIPLPDVSGIALPVGSGTNTGGSCQILDLVIQPIDLDLLGLQVSLDTVHLNITAQQGPGNLLGNLLCSVTGLLDNGTGLNGLANLLNNLLRL